jgi:2,4-didehydro-3-deoxy-L-rhamnonate hydrolase
LRLVSFLTGEASHFGCILGDQVLDLAHPAAARSRPDPAAAGPADLRGLLAGGDRALDAVRSLAAEASAGGKAAAALRPLTAVQLAAPLASASKIIAVGRNYLDHASEATVDLPEVPRIFPKWPSTVIGPGEAIVKPAATKQLDWEVEMGVVIGKPAHKVPRADALSYVAGYTIVNDVSARDIQFSKPEQLALSKNYRTFTPMGAWIVTPDEFGPPDQATIRAWVNGEIMQDSSTGKLIFDVPYLVSFLSGVLDLEPGDIISTGTPSGVGAFRDPPVSLQAGDVVRMELGGVCELENPVIDE